jgi:type II secretory pathway component PulF
MDYDILIYIMCLFSISAVISHCFQCYKLRHVSNIVMTPVSISIVLTLSVLVLSYCVKPSLYYMYTGEEIKIPIIAYIYLLASLLIVTYSFLCLGSTYFLMDMEILHL